jgi:hypothetical protein
VELQVTFLPIEIPSHELSDASSYYYCVRDGRTTTAASESIVDLSSTCILCGSTVTCNPCSSTCAKVCCAC